MKDFWLKFEENTKKGRNFQKNDLLRNLNYFSEYWSNFSKSALFGAKRKLDKRLYMGHSDQNGENLQ